MEWKGIFILCCIAAVTLALPVQDTKLVTESKPGQEYVFVQSSSSGARPIARKDKTEDQDRPFETAHKLPPSLTFALIDAEEAEESVPVKKAGKKVHKRAASPAEPPAPAPPGAVKINVAALLQKYKEEIKSSTTEKPSSTTISSTSKTSRRRGSRRRSEREAKEDDVAVATSPSPVLTTSRIAAKSIDTDVVGSASDKQRSRIQVKKGPNGQEYEYEYVYYYYDDDEDSKDKVTNSHDGPAKNSIARSDKTKKEKPAPEANEVVPSRSKTRGRQLGEEDNVQEERLPANTRFPPRSRNLNTTPLPEEEAKPTPTRPRGRGRPTTTETAALPVTEDDNVSDETQGSRGRTRANVRRPSLELVDSESFNTHSSPQSAGGSPSFPAQLPAGPQEPVEKAADSRRKPAPVSEVAEESSKPSETAESTTLVTGMEKVALDLYAISQGTQKLFGEEDTELSTEDEKVDATTQESSSTEEVETSTTTTTTTTTPAPTTTTTKTTTTTTEAPTKASRFGGRRTPLSGRKSSTTTTEIPITESKLKKVGRPSFGGRARARPTSAPAVVEEDVQKEESKPVSQSKPSRTRFGAAKPRGRTTAAPEENKEETSTSAPATATQKPSLPRARPSFNALRGRGRSTTAAPSTEESSGDTDSQSSSSETSSTTTSRPPRRIAGATANIKPLRPGPRINLSGRRPSTTTTTENSTPEEDHHVAGDEEEKHEEAASEKEEAPAPTSVDSSPLGRIRKNRLNIQPKAKVASAASAQVQVRRVNPLLNRRKPGQTTEATSSSEAPSSEATEPEAEEPAAETEAAPSSTTTTEEPKGLNKLLAGRRRLAARTPGTINHK